jgi:hypothetical protein
VQPSDPNRERHLGPKPRRPSRMLGGDQTTKPSSMAYL